MTGHNTEAVQAAAEVILPALAKVGSPDSSGEWSWLRSLAFDAACAAMDAAVPVVQRQALLSLAAELEDTAKALSDEEARGGGRAWLLGVAAGSGTEGCTAALRHAARLARQQAETGPAPAGEAAPVSREGQEPPGDLGALDAAARAMRDVIASAQVVIGLKDRLTDAAGQLERAGRDAAAAEREHLAHLAEERHARYSVAYPGGDGYLSVGSESFADLIRERGND